MPDFAPIHIYPCMGGSVEVGVSADGIRLTVDTTSGVGTVSLRDYERLALIRALEALGSPSTTTEG